MMNATTQPAPASPATVEQEPEVIVWITVAAALILGFFLMYFTTNQTTHVDDAGGTSLSYPTTWVPATEKGAEFAVADFKGGGTFGDRASVFKLAKSDLLPRQGGLTEAAANWTLAQQDARVGYRTLGVDTTTVAGKPAVTIEGAYLMDSPFGGTTMPALMHSYDTIVLSGDTFYVLSYATASTDNDHATAENNKLVDSWRVP